MKVKIKAMSSIYKKRIFLLEYPIIVSGFRFADLPKNLEDNDIIDFNKDYKTNSCKLEVFRFGPLTEEENIRYNQYKDLQKEFDYNGIPIFKESIME